MMGMGGMPGFPPPMMAPTYGTPSPVTPPVAGIKQWDSTMKAPAIQVSPDEKTATCKPGTHEYSIVGKFPMQSHGKDYFSVLVNK